MFLETKDAQRRAQVVGLMERVFADLEISPSRVVLAQQRYEAMGAWLAESSDPLLRGLAVYLQGSTAIGTTVRPIGTDEHDVDLVSRLVMSSSMAPWQAKKAIGDRLKQSPHYAPLLVEMQRCWRLNYANEFHMDITPSIPNPGCEQGGELVPDKALRVWKTSNPLGYRNRFLRRAALKPRFREFKTFQRDAMAGSVEAFPSQPRFKNILQRSVQVAKRHRDMHFERQGLDISHRPISVIVTTLAALSYEYCVTNFIYDDELQLLLDVLRHMPDFIESRLVDGQVQWFVWNETTSGENFAEKWNQHPERARAFYSWHASALNDMARLMQFEGIDGLSKRFEDSFGRAPTQKAIQSMTDEVAELRGRGKLYAAPGVGLVAGAGAATSATPVAANTFFGREP